MRDSSYAQFEPDGAIMSVETLVGKELAWHIPNLNEGVRDMSPSERLFVTQIGLEPVLRARAEELGAETPLQHRAGRVRAGCRRRDVGHS